MNMYRSIFKDVLYMKGFQSYLLLRLVCFGNANRRLSQVSVYMYTNIMNNDKMYPFVNGFLSWESPLMWWRHCGQVTSGLQRPRLVPVSCGEAGERNKHTVTQTQKEGDTCYCAQASSQQLLAVVITSRSRHRGELRVSSGVAWERNREEQVLIMEWTVNSLTKGVRTWRYDVSVWLK